MSQSLVSVSKLADNSLAKCYACGATAGDRTLFWFHPLTQFEPSGAHFVKLVVCERHRDQMINDLAICLEEMVK